MKKFILTMCLLFAAALVVNVGDAQGLPRFVCDTNKAGGPNTASQYEVCGVRGNNQLQLSCDINRTPPLVCSSNEFNTCPTRVCLVPAGGICTGDFDCDGGTFCDPTTKRCTTATDDQLATGADLRDTIRRAINVILGFLGIITVIMVLYGGFQWITAGGNQENIGKGRQTIIWAFIGAVVISIAWTISSYFLNVAQQIA